ncbi:MAG: 5-methylthioadenosine/S-adenosylhomocysteine deaminase [Spirochaetes bacterium]|nr:MAG: 5-methylthioadenosine/S-adenosylhomocysteine deaminase [Spirochaetota bacterium]
MSLLVKNALVEGILSDIVVQEGRIASITPAASAQSSGEAMDEVFDARGMAAVPSLANAHTHAAMTLLRGLAEDMELEAWLTQAIWPREARMSPEDIYWGTRLAALEMIASGTSMCQDMYLNPVAQARAARDSGMRFVVNYALIDGMDEAKGEAQRKACEIFFNSLGAEDFGPRVKFNLAAHSVYATCPTSLKWLGQFSHQRGLTLHIHLAETKHEVEACLARTEMRPAAYLDSLGCLGPNLIAAHALWLDEGEWNLLAKRGVALVHNPASNMKLASGPAFDFEAAKSRGIRVLLGTDGAASNNSLDLFADMKLAALLQKHEYKDPRRLDLDQLFEAAGRAGHEVLGDGAGRLECGKAADFILVDLDRPSMTPCLNLRASMVYAGGGQAVDSMVCDGKFIMRHGAIEGSGEVLIQARERARVLAHASK